MSESRTCPECSGEGWVADHAEECYARGGDCVHGACPVQAWCPSCNGSGEIDV